MKKITKHLRLLFIYYLRFCAQIQLKKNSPQIIGITGSVGKSSVSSILSSVIAQKTSIKSSNKANSEIGLPLNILGFPSQFYRISDVGKLALQVIWKLLSNWEKYAIYIAEMSVDSPYSPNNMEYLLSIFQPKIGIFLNAYSVHSEPFDHLISTKNESAREMEMRKIIAEEKGKMITNLPVDGYAILNIDDENVAEFATKTEASVITFGFDKKATIQISKVETKSAGTWFTFEHVGKVGQFIVPGVALGSAWGYSIAAVIGASLALGYGWEETIIALKNEFIIPPGRMSLFDGMNNSLIIDSSYNSSLIPLIDALNVLDQVDGKRKIAILGDMREMGKEARLAHITAATYAKNICDQVILVGPLMKKFALPILKEKAIYVENAHEASKIMKQNIREDDIILVKGSQNTLFLEHVVENLLKNKEDAQKLCRRGEFWNKKRQEVGLI